MNYEKKYKEALEWARKVIQGKVGFVLDEVLEKFPELKKLEDERIRKGLIAFLTGFKEELGNPPTYCKVSTDEAIAWLEKQGEQDMIPLDKAIKFLDDQLADDKDEVTGEPFINFQNHGAFKETFISFFKRKMIEKQGEQKLQGKSALEAINKEKVDNQNCIKSVDEIGQKFKVGDIVQYITDSTDIRKIEEIDTLCNMYHTDSSPIMFEVEDEWKVVVNAEDVEQEHTDNVKPKFHVGDWIVFDNGNIEHIISVGTHGYTFDDGDYLLHEQCDKIARLWTIQDAKDGDVLVDKSDGRECPFIFKETKPSNIKTDMLQPLTVLGYCGIGGAGFTKGSGWGDTVNCTYYPATKAQRDKLEKAMTDAGYTFDFDKKELKKMEQKFHEGDWAVSNLDGKARRISEVHFDEYNSYYVVNEESVNLEEYDRLHHLWSIDDAMDGNVLHSPSHHLIWIYKDNKHYYACVNMNYVTKDIATNGLIIIPNDVCPATKDEQTILFARMKEAGYEWDAKKKS